MDVLDVERQDDRSLSSISDLYLSKSILFTLKSLHVSLYSLNPFCLQWYLQMFVNSIYFMEKTR